MTNNKQELNDFIKKLSDEEKSANTIIAYTNAIKSYLDLFDDITKENMIEYKAIQLERLKPATVKLHLVALNNFCSFIGKSECKVKMVRTQKSSKTENVPTLDEYNYLLSRLLDDGKYKLYWMVRFMGSTGVRVSELLSLNKRCLTTGTMELYSKGKVRSILIPEKLIEESRDYFETVDNDLLFPNRYNTKMGTRGFAFTLLRCAEKYNIRREVMHPHAFRHFFAIQFLNHGGNLALLSDLLGHESIKTTAIYLTLSESEQRKQLNDCLKW